MGLSWMGLNILKKMSLELLGLLLKLELLLLYAFYHVRVGGRDAPTLAPLYLRNKCIQQQLKQQH